MKWSTVQRILGALLMAFSPTMLPPIGVSLWYADTELEHFLLTLAVTFLTGLILWLPVRTRAQQLRVRDGFIVVALFWIVLGILSTLPFHFSPHLPFTEAMFESISGFTTTGATVIAELENLPPSVLYYRQQLQWLGGMGIVVLAVAVLPMLRIGGMQLYQAETPGPMKGKKLTPRIAHTAQLLWGCYVALTVSCAVAFWFAGMTPFDAVCHSFATVSTGGFSTHDASLGYFDSLTIETIANVFMLLGAINFAIHFLAWRHRSLLTYFRDVEVRTFLLIVGGVTLVVTFFLGYEGSHGNLFGALRFALFQVISIITSTGFTTTDFATWPSFLPIMLIYISFIGGCAGSTAGGMKVMRMIILLKQAGREVDQLIHPRGQFRVKVGGATVSENALRAVWGFFALYVFSTATLTLLMIGTGLDVISAFSAVAACLNVLGPGLGQVAGNFSDVSTPGHWILIFAMLLGRLEIYTLIVLLTPNFWRI